MARRPLTTLCCLVAAVAALVLPAAPAVALRKAPPLPAWSLVGTYDMPVDVGFVSLLGSYDFDLDGNAGFVSLAYDPKARITGNGLVGSTFFSAFATSSVGEDALQHVSIVDAPKNPAFTFDGVVESNGRDLVGHYVRSNGFGGLVGTAEGEITLRRTQPTFIPSNFRLRLTTTMDRKGRVRGAVGPDRKEIRAAIDVYPARTLDGGVVRGKVTTRASDGTTSASLKITGKGWLITMKGPVDVDGFHAVARIRAGGFDVPNVAIVLPVTEGPKPPPPPPPPDPDKNRRVTGAAAQVVAGSVRVSKSRLPTKFFGAPANVTIDFPSAGIGAPMVADPASASTLTPTRFFVKIGSKTYGTGTAPGLVTLTVRQYSPSPGGGIEVLCQGKVADASGRTKNVNLVINAVVGN